MSDAWDEVAASTRYIGSLIVSMTQRLKKSICIAVNGLYYLHEISIQNAGRPGDPPYDGKFQPIRGKSSPNSGQAHNCVSRFIEDCNAPPEVSKLNPAHHLLPLAVL